MRIEEAQAIAAALDSTVLRTSTLAGGFSHETCLLTLTDGQVVVRLGGPDPTVEAAVMATARPHVPVPQVLLVMPARAPGVHPVMVLEHVAGTLLSRVLAVGSHSQAALAELGAEVGRVVAGIGAVTFERPGFFLDPQLTVRTGRPWSAQLPGFALSCMAGTPANMARFGADYPAGFLDGFRAAFGDHQPAGSVLAEDWGHLGRVLDMFALSDLVTRPVGHPVADQAAATIRRWVAAGVPRCI